MMSRSRDAGQVARSRGAADDGTVIDGPEHRCPMDGSRPVHADPGRLAMIVGLIALVLAGCIGIVEPPGPPHLSTSLDETVHADPSRPVRVLTVGSVGRDAAD